MTQNELLATLPETFVIYMARHATPDRSRIDLPYQIPPGPELNERGLREAAELGAYLHGIGIGPVQASPLERTLRTASVTSEICDTTMEVNPDLAEWRTDEIEKAVQERVQRAFIAAAALSNQRSAPVVLVTHGGPVLVMLKTLGVPLESLNRCRIYESRNVLPPAGAWRVERLDGRLNIEMVFIPSGYAAPVEEFRHYQIALEEPAGA